MTYTRLEEPDDSETFETWQFRRSAIAHNTIMGFGTVSAVVGIAVTEEYENKYPSMAVAIVLGAASIAARTACAASEHQEAARQKCIAAFVVISCLWLGGDAWICTYGTLDWITWLAYALAYMLAAPIGASLSLTFAIRSWVYVLLSLLCWPSYAAIVVIAKVPQDQSIAQTQWLIGMLLFVSWVMSIVFYAVFDTHARALYSLTRQNHDLAMAKSRYTAAISHDFNTPISILRMQLDKLESDANRDGHSFKKRTYSSMNKALDLLSMIRRKAIDIYKLEQGKSLRPERKSFSIKTLIDDLASHAESMPKKDGVRLEVKITDELLASPHMTTDPGWILLILLNFLSNAFKHTRRGTVTVVAGIVGPMLRVEVADEGLGVPDDLVEHLFKAFSQASKYRFGTGLGLYHAYELARALGGTASYKKNEPSGGAAFSMEVPFVPATEPASSEEACRLREVIVHASDDTSDSFTSTKSGSLKSGSLSPPVLRTPELPVRVLPSVEPNSTSFSGLRVLVVEDDPFIREVMSNLLEEAGVRHVETANDGEEGLERLTNGGEPISLALIDLQMPMMDGLECVRSMRAWEAKLPEASRRHTIAVAVSANSEDEGSAEAFFLAGFDAVEPKPLSAERLVKLLRSV